MTKQGVINSSEITIVIPTIARATLPSTINSIRLDLPDAQILCVAHTEDVPALILLLEKTATNVEIISVSKRSIGHSLNAGIERVHSKYLAFFSDDDIWISGHIQELQKMIECSNSVDFALGQVVFSRESVQIIRPSKMIKNSFLELLNNQWWKTGDKYVSLTSFLGLTMSVKGFKFDETTMFWEDILWLLSLERAGVKFQQYPITACIVVDSPIRGAKRITFGNLCLIIDTYFTDSVWNSRKFLINIATKNFILASDLAGIRMIRRLTKNKPTRISEKLSNIFAQLILMVIELIVILRIVHKRIQKPVNEKNV